ncbi:MAG: hypothetical protein IH984_06530 [Planctomycetes bacterium]|nr:hypothetical protein [Planctomycetota bacterium]
MTEQINPITLTAKCPRCGYDLRGAIDTWREQCPLLGICTECGLEVKWAEVLHPEKFEPQWCIEFAPSGKRILISCGKTFIRSFWPFRFWSMLKMSLDIRWKRLALYMAVLVLPILIGYVCVQSATAIRVRSYLQEQFDLAQVSIQRQIASFGAVGQRIKQTYKDNYQQRLTMLQSLQDQTNPDEDTLSLIEETKLWIEAVDEQGLDAWAQQKVQVQAQRLQQSNATMSIDQSYIAAIAEAVFMPWSNTSFGSISAGAVTQPYPPPLKLRLYLQNDYGDIPKTLVFTLLGFWTCLLFPLTFIFLPISRKRAKVRWGHVLRVTCYSVFIPSTVICIALLSASLGFLLSGISDLCLGMAHFSERYFMLPMLIIWWAVAIKRYMFIAHGWMTAILLTAILALGYISLFWLLFPSVLLKMFVD